MRRALVIGLILAGCASRKPLPHLGQVPEFQLTDQQGKTFSRSSLDGKVWVADFIYTTCPGPCPRMTSHMRAMQDATPANIRLVSFSVDPANDTPPVLAAYAKKFGADNSRWTFLTGNKDLLNSLDRDAFKLGIGLDHSTRFVLIDRRERIRGYYGIAEGNPAEKIAADAARLQKEGD